MEQRSFQKHETGLDTLTNAISKYFTIIILAVTLLPESTGPL